MTNEELLQALGALLTQNSNAQTPPVVLPQVPQNVVTVDFTDPRANWEESDRASVPDGVCLRLYTGNYNGLYTNLTLEKSKVKGRDAHVSLSQLRALKASADLLCGGDLNALVAEGIERLAVATEEVKAAKEAAGVTKKAKPKTQGEIDGEKALDILKKYRQQTA